MAGQGRMLMAPKLDFPQGRSAARERRL